MRIRSFGRAQELSTRTGRKILKAIFIDKKDKTPPFSHNLVYLSEKAGLELNDENLELLEEVSDFNLEARYPDDKGINLYKQLFKYPSIYFQVHTIQ